MAEAELERGGELARGLSLTSDKAEKLVEGWTRGRARRRGCARRLVRSACRIRHPIGGCRRRWRTVWHRRNHTTALRRDRCLVHHCALLPQRGLAHTLNVPIPCLFSSALVLSARGRLGRDGLGGGDLRRGGVSGVDFGRGGAPLEVGVTP